MLASRAALAVLFLAGLLASCLLVSDWGAAGVATQGRGTEARAKGPGIKLTRKFKRRGARAKQAAVIQHHCDAYLTMEDNGEEEETELCDRCCKAQNANWLMASVMPNYCFCRAAGPAPAS